MSRTRRRPFLWAALLLVVFFSGWGLQSVVAVHRERVAGLPDGYPPPMAGADLPVLGVNVALEQYDHGALLDVVDRIAAGGFVWVRQSFYWDQIVAEPGEYDWSQADRLMDSLAAHPELRPVAVIDDSRGIPPADPDPFARFAAAFARRYGDRVDEYQVWDEPNLGDRWGGGPVNPVAYADLLARTATAIRQADPGARILLAGLAPTVEQGPANLSDVRFLESLYRAGAAPYFDVAAGKPYGFDTGPEDRRVDEEVLNFSRLVVLRRVMVAGGDGDKPLWASHWGWNALPAGWTGGPSAWGQVDEATQARRTVAALERARTEWPWAGGMILEHYQPAVAPADPRWGFALVGADGVPRPAYDAVAAWAARLPDAAPVGGYPAANRWTTYGPGWQVGPLGADPGPAPGPVTFRFEGTRVALSVRRGPHRAFLYVTVDGEPANALPRDADGRAYVVLYDDRPSSDTVPLATGLTPGVHTVTVVPELGQGQWSLVDWRVGTEPVRDGYGWKLTGLGAVGAAALVLLVLDGRRVDWRFWGRRILGWPEGRQVALAVGLTGLLWATAWIGWRPGGGVAWRVASLFLLPPLAGLFVLRLDLGFVLVALAAPFYRLPEHLVYGILSLPEVLVLLCGGAFLVRRRAGWGGRTAPVALDWAVLALSLAATLAGLAAEDPVAAFFELRVVFVLPAAYYGLLRLAHLGGASRWRLVDGFVLGGACMAVVGLVQYALGRNVVIAEGGLSRLASVYASPNGVALYLGRVWPLLAAVLLWERRSSRRWFYGLALVVVTLAIGLTFSKGALLLGLPAAVLVVGWRAGGRYRWAALGLVVAGGLALVPLLRVPRFASLLDVQEGSTFVRLQLWRSSLAMIGDSPWLGVGPGNFVRAYRTRYVLPAAWREFNLGHAHNIWLDHWARLGLPGLLAGLELQVVFWRRAWRWRRDDPLALGLCGSVAALLAHGLVDNTLFYPDLMLAFFLLLALATTLGPRRPRGTAAAG